jgi:hypothetical protein
MEHAMRQLFLAGLMTLTLSGAIAAPAGPPVFLLPMACSELLPDTDPFIRFLDSVARGNLLTENALSKRIFRLMALREKVAETIRIGRERNPVDIMVQKTLCFYRQQKEPLKPVPYDDEVFLEFLKGGIDDMEKQISAAIRQEEIERFQKKEFERKLEQNREREDQLRRQAQRDADKEMKQISESAKRQVKNGT